MSLNSIYRPQDPILAETKLTQLFEVVNHAGKKTLRPAHQSGAENDVMNHTILTALNTIPSFSASVDSSDIKFILKKEDIGGEIAKLRVQLPLTGVIKSGGSATAIKGYFAKAIKNVRIRLPGNQSVQALNSIPLMVLDTMDVTDDALVRAATPKGFGAAWAYYSLTAGSEVYFYIDITGALRNLHLNMAHLNGDIHVEFNFAKYTEFMETDDGAGQDFSLTVGSDIRLLVDWIDVDEGQHKLTAEAYNGGMDFNFIEYIECPTKAVSGTTELKTKMDLSSGLTAGLIVAIADASDLVQEAALDFIAPTKFRITDSKSTNIGFTNADQYTYYNMYLNEFHDLLPSSFCFKKNILIIPMNNSNIYDTMTTGTYKGGYKCDGSEMIYIQCADSGADILYVYQMIYRKLHIQKGQFTPIVDSL